MRQANSRCALNGCFQVPFSPWVPIAVTVSKRRSFSHAIPYACYKMKANIISISEMRLTVISETVTCKALSKKRLTEFLFLMAMMFKPFVDK